MTIQNQIWKCEVCGNVIEILHKGADSLVCCGKPMVLQEEKIDDEGQEKHVPIIEGQRVRVSSVEHPMEPEHYIEWIEASDGKITSKRLLIPGDKPEAEFSFEVKSVRAYCNLHGLWKSK